MEAIVVRRSLNEEIRYQLHRRKLTQIELAKGMCVSRGLLCDRLNGKRSWHLDSLQAVAAFFEMPVSDLLRRAEWRAAHGLTMRQTG